MASFKNMLRGAGARNRYEAVRGKENKGYLETPRSKSTQSQMAKSAESQSCHGASSEKSKSQSNFRRNSSVTQSVRDVVGTIRQVIFICHMCFHIYMFNNWLVLDQKN
jgi:hypothetical protein